MKRLLFPLCCVCVGLILSCGEDRTYEYEAKTARDHWMLAAMQENYLWGDSIRVEKIQWKDYFAAPATFFAKLTAFAPDGDRWSWCQIDTVEEDPHPLGHLSHVDSYGLDYIYMNDPTGATNRVYARLTTVLAGSPADRCGLSRGDFIGMIDGIRLTTSNGANLEKGKSRTLVRSVLGVNMETQEFVWARHDTLLMEPSERVTDVAFSPVHQYSVGEKTVAYLQCNKMSASAAEIQSLMVQVEATNAWALVLDLRLCNDGDFETARLLASYLISEDHANETFANIIYRKNQEHKNQSYGFDASAVARSLSVRKLYVITSSNTVGAAEWMIHGVRAVEDNDFVTVVGTVSDGQNVITEALSGVDYYVTLHPVVAYITHAKGGTDSYAIEPDVPVNENEYADLFPYGDVREVVLAEILNLIGEDE